MNRRNVATARGVSVVYGTGELAISALDTVSLSVNAGEFLAVVGPSGSGKTTLLRVLAGMQSVTTGEVAVAADPDRTQAAMVYQDYRLVSFLTAAENVGLALEVQTKKRADPDGVNTVLESVGVAHLSGRFPSQLSGGEQQRVAIARGIVVRPLMLLADEPTGALDRDMSFEIARLFRRLADVREIAVVVATHDRDVSDHAHRVATLSSGQLIESDAVL
ncbi:putative ABC transporter ATP-binding protein/MT1014 [bacterium BMS3Bbin02]|nr:putative ABC transporter ATP-binding protein/MT1014 [bacterium BMS3Bbin02]